LAELIYSPLCPFSSEEDLLLFLFTIEKENG
jgi:hypothetical protein